MIETGQIKYLDSIENQQFLMISINTEEYDSKVSEAKQTLLESKNNFHIPIGAYLRNLDTMSSNNNFRYKIFFGNFISDYYNTLYIKDKNSLLGYMKDNLFISKKRNSSRGISKNSRVVRKNNNKRYFFYKVGTYIPELHELLDNSPQSSQKDTILLLEKILKTIVNLWTLFESNLNDSKCEEIEKNILTYTIDIVQEFPELTRYDGKKIIIRFGKSNAQQNNNNLKIYSDIIIVDNEHFDETHKKFNLGAIDCSSIFG